MANILILFSTTDGQTINICNRIKAQLEEKQNQVEMLEITEFDPSQISQFDKVLIGASIRYGKHNKKVYAFIRENRAALDSIPNAFFTVNAVARKEEKNTPETNPYIIKFLRQVEWKPNLEGVFAGRIAYPLYGPFDRHIIRFIMWITKGPTDLSGTYEFTNWDTVAKFAQSLDEL